MKSRSWLCAPAQNVGPNLLSKTAKFTGSWISWLYLIKNVHTLENDVTWGKFFSLHRPTIRAVDKVTDCDGQRPSPKLGPGSNPLLVSCSQA